MQDLKKHTQVLFKFFIFSKYTHLDKNFKQKLNNVSIEQTITIPKTFSRKRDFKGKTLYHRISFDTKGPISPSSGRNSYIMVIVDALHLLTL